MDVIRIVKVEQDGEDGLLVTFSDETIAGYVVEELLELRPVVKKRARLRDSTQLSYELKLPHTGHSLLLFSCTNSRISLAANNDGRRYVALAPSVPARISRGPRY